MVSSISTHSQDLYIRLRAAELGSLNLQHVYSEVLVKRQHVISGLTEWSADVERVQPLSLAWDWICLNDGALLLNSAGNVRSNVMLICPKGYDQGPKKTQTLLTKVIQQFDWEWRVRVDLKNS